jgi:CRP-like cAMP-binding protein
MSARIQKLRLRAKALEQKGDLRGALAAHREILDENEADMASRQRLAELSLQLGDRAAALEARTRIAEQLARDGFLFKAIAAAKEILRIAPEHTATQALLAELYARPRPGRASPLDRTSDPTEPIGPAMSPLRALARGGAGRVGGPAGASAGGAPSLATTPLFSELPRAAFVSFVEDLETRRFEDGARIVREGEPGRAFYVLVSGRVRVEKASPAGPQRLAILDEGAFFGEMALLDDCPRTASVVAEGPVELLEIDRARLDALVARHPAVGKALRRFYEARLLATSVATHALFRAFTPAEQRALVERFRARALAADEILIQPGRRGEGLFLLLSGRFAVHTPSGEPLALLGPGAIVGEMSLLSDAPTTAEVRARTAGWVLRLAPDDFRAVTRDRPEVLGLLADLMSARQRPASDDPAADALV